MIQTVIKQNMSFLKCSGHGAGSCWQFSWGEIAFEFCRFSSSICENEKYRKRAKVEFHEPVNSLRDRTIPFVVGPHKDCR